MTATIELDPDASALLGTSALPGWSSDSVYSGFLGRFGYLGRERIELDFSHSLNGAGPKSAFDANWQRLRGAFPAHKVVARLNQVHGRIVHTVGASYDGSRLRGDGMVTATPGTILTILTADCVPVLMIDCQRRIAGALHAGWRGVIAHIAGEGVAAMRSAGARVEDLEVRLGPAIGACCFEVDRALAQRFREEVPRAGAHTRTGRPGKAFLDLRAILTDQFIGAGVARANVQEVGPCTVCSRDRYFSRRGDGAVRGLQLSFVGFSAAPE